MLCTPHQILHSLLCCYLERRNCTLRSFINCTSHVILVFDEMWGREGRGGEGFAQIIHWRNDVYKMWTAKFQWKIRLLPCRCSCISKFKFIFETIRYITMVLSNKTEGTVKSTKFLGQQSVSPFCFFKLLQIDQSQLPLSPTLFP